MAKQRGLIQISGKLNDMCYFQRKGSTTGLIRRINTGMSERVKSGEEYENLRTANSFFGACLSYASITLNMMSNRGLYMLKPNRLSLLAGGLFRLRNKTFGNLIEETAGFNYGFSYVYSFVFDKVVKNKLFENFISIPRSFSDIPADENIVISVSELDLESYCTRTKSIGCAITITGAFYIYGTTRNNINGKYIFEEYGSVNSRTQYIWRQDEGDLEISIPPSGADDAANFAIITVYPITRFVGGRPIKNYVGAACGLVGITYI